MSAPDTGLYRDAYERDSCGFGLIANLDDQPSHWLVQTAITSLNRLTHRGAIAGDGKTGDGCGLLLKKPEAFLRAVAAEAGIELTERFASGLVFLSRDPGLAQNAREILEAQLVRQGLELAGWRKVPIDSDACGEQALKTLPHIEQIYVNCSLPDMDEASFNRKLYMARRFAEKSIEETDPGFYMPSLSATTIVFKGMVMPEYLTQFYRDLEDPRLEASVAVFHQRFSTNTLPQWRLAHPYRYLAHNGEINTVQGNRNWAQARGPLFRSPLLPNLADVQPLVSRPWQNIHRRGRPMVKKGADPASSRIVAPCPAHGIRQDRGGTYTAVRSLIQDELVIVVLLVQRGRHEVVLFQPRGQTLKNYIVSADVLKDSDRLPILSTNEIRIDLAASKIGEASTERDYFAELIRPLPCHRE